MVILEPLIHRDLLCIAIKGKYNARISSLIRSFRSRFYPFTNEHIRLRTANHERSTIGYIIFGDDQDSFSS